MKDELLTPAEAGALLGVGVQALKNDRNRPAGPRLGYTRTLGGHARYRRSDVERFISLHAVGASRDPDFEIEQATTLGRCPTRSVVAARSTT